MRRRIRRQRGGEAEEKGRKYVERKEKEDYR
jgi:hypothetical protein